MHLKLSPGAKESSIVIKNDNGQTIPITWLTSSIGRFRISIPNQTGIIPLNTLPDPPATLPTADFFLDPHSTIAETDTFTLVGYRTQIPGHAISTPPGQSMINPATSQATIGINPAPQTMLLGQYIASAFPAGNAIQSTSVLSDVHATETPLLTLPGHA
jgi:hypothetical protein